MRIIGHLVRDIQKCEYEEDALDKYTTEVFERGLTIQWIKSVFKNKKSLPVLDLEYDVHGKGIIVLDSMGISKETQSKMWENWALLPNDVKASWVQDFKKIDPADTQDLFAYTSLLVDLLK